VRCFGAPAREVRHRGPVLVGETGVQPREGSSGVAVFSERSTNA
jgi:hypothetical protein